MNRFSIKEAFSYTLSTYRNYFLSVLAATGCMALGILFCGVMPEFISHKIIMPSMSEVAVLIQQQKQLGPEKTHEFLRALFDNVSFTQLLLLVVVYLMTLFLYGFLCLGFSRFFLHLKDYQQADISQMVCISVQQVLRFIGAIFLVICRIGGWLFVGTFGMIFATSVANKILKLSVIPESLFIVLIIAAGVVFAYWYVPYTFLPFTIVDKPNLGIRETLKQCQFVFRSNRGKTILAIIAMLLAVIPLGLVLVVPVMILALGVGVNVIWVTALGNIVCTFVAYPPFFLFNSFLYRKLARKE